MIENTIQYNVYIDNGTTLNEIVETLIKARDELEKIGASELKLECDKLLSFTSGTVKEEQ